MKKMLMLSIPLILPTPPLPILPYCSCQGAFEIPRLMRAGIPPSFSVFLCGGRGGGAGTVSDGGGDISQSAAVRENLLLLRRSQMRVSDLPVS